MSILYIKKDDAFVPIPAIEGQSAYQIAVRNGFTGTEVEWLASLQGDPGNIDNLTRANIESALASEPGKVLTTNDFTTILFDKLNGLNNYDDTAAIARIVALETWKTALTGTSADDIINTFSEIEAFLQGITGANTLTTMLASLRTDILGVVAGSYLSNGTKTDGIAEGTSNLYFTNARAVSALSSTLSGYSLSIHTHTKSQITDFPSSMPASDVSSWAKASTKPSYSQSEINNDDHTVKDASYVHTDNNFTATYKGVLDREGVNTVTTLAALPVNKNIIYATLSAATDLSLASALTAGQSLTIVCMPSADITQPLPVTGGFTSMDGDSISLVSGKLAEISILCYATGLYSISSKIAS